MKLPEVSWCFFGLTHKSTWVMQQWLLLEICHSLVLWRCSQTIVGHSESLTYLLGFPMYPHGSFHYWNT